MTPLTPVHQNCHPDRRTGAVCRFGAEGSVFRFRFQPRSPLSVAIPIPYIRHSERSPRSGESLFDLHVTRIACASLMDFSQRLWHSHSWLCSWVSFSPGVPQGPACSERFLRRVLHLGSCVPALRDRCAPISVHSVLKALFRFARHPSLTTRSCFLISDICSLISRNCRPLLRNCQLSTEDCRLPI